MLKTIEHRNSLLANYTLEIIISYLWITMKINKQTNKQTNKNKAKLTFYERIKVFLYKKCENTSISYGRRASYGHLMDVLFFTFRRPKCVL